jgi:hypothetical protein
MGVILDLVFKNNSPIQLIEKCQNILEICSILINLYDSENPGTQIILIVSKNQQIGQLTHLTGNIKHHNQGIWCFIYGNRKIGDFDLGFFFSERVQVLKYKITKYELFFITEGNLDFLGSNFFAVYMGKESRKFTIISPAIKSFALQILTKITGGKYVTLISKQKIVLSNILLMNFQRIFLSETTYLLKSFPLIYRLILKKTISKTKDKIFVKRSIKFCPSCRKNCFFKKKDWCENCGIFLISQQHLFRNNNSVLKKSRFIQHSLHCFNLFGLLVFEKTTNLSSEKNQSFNFLRDKKIKFTDFAKKSINRGIDNNYNEILLGKFY